MIIFPAIDLYDGKAVRLYKGDYKKMTVYNENPLEVAKDFRDCGGSWLHLVDLEGAKSGETPNFETIKKLVEESGLKVQLGGGIRVMETLCKYLDIGVSRVILGTAAIENRDFLIEAVERFGDKIAVSVDCRDGLVATHGWTKTSNIGYMEFCKTLEDMGVRTVICTDISKDGAMKGTNIELYKELTNSFKIDFIASGGVSYIEDVASLREINIYGGIIGKAYYTKAIDLKTAMEVAK